MIANNTKSLAHLTLLTEALDLDNYQSNIQIDKSGEKKYYIEGIFIQCNVLNRNNRIYPKDVIRYDVESYIENYVKQHRAVGELGHPNSPEINLPLISHKFVSLRENGNDYVGKAEIISAGMGLIAKGLMDAGVKLGVSTRAVGTVTPNKLGQNVVSKDFHLISAGDIVYEPSAPSAFVENLMEHSSWIWENGVLKEESLESAKNRVDYLSKTRQLQDSELSAVLKWVINNNKGY